MEEMTPERLNSEITQLENTPGFLIPDGSGSYFKNMNRPRYDALVAQRDKLYDMRREQQATMAAFQVETPDAESPPSWQKTLIADAQAEMSALEELGFEPADIPADIQDWQVKDLKMQRAVAESNFETFNRLAEESLNELRVPPENMQLFRAFTRASDLNPDTREKIAEAILLDIRAANKIRSSR